MSGIIGASPDMKSGMIGGIIIPSWSATISASYAHTAGNIIEFNNITASGKFANPAASYDTTNDGYIAPVTGYYGVYCQILFQGMDSGDSAHDSIYLRCGGTERAVGHRRAYYRDTYTGVGGYMGDCTYQIIYATAGQLFDVKGQKNESIHGNPDYTFFSGHLLNNI